jgi:hypothetical protein
LAATTGGGRSERAASRAQAISPDLPAPSHTKRPRLSPGRGVEQRECGEAGDHDRVHRLDQRIEADGVLGDDLHVGLIGVEALDRAQLVFQTGLVPRPTRSDHKVLALQIEV